MTNTSQRVSSLQRILLFIVVMSVAIPACLVGFVLIKENYQRTVELEANSTARNYIDLLASGMILPLWNVAPVLGQPLLDSISADPSVAHISVTGVDGEAFLSFERQQRVDREALIELEKEVFYNQNDIGQVRLAYSTLRAKAHATYDAQLLATIIVCQLVFTVGLVSYFLRRRVISPLKQLKEAAGGIASGDLKTSIPKPRDDEFGELATQLESMRGSLEQSFTSLEDGVKERTLDLVEVNKELKHTLDQLKQTQGTLVQQEKLAALGELVAGISHELNTPLGNGLTVASSLLEETDKTIAEVDKGITRKSLEVYLSDMAEGGRLVVSSLERASELVSSFKQVATDRASAKRRHFDLETMLIETRFVVSPAFKNTPFTIDIECEKHLTMDSYPGPLSQIITNLLTNTLVHAFEDRNYGVVLITGASTREGNVCIRVIDDGVGIDENNLNRIFDPFFTTKLGEGGSGLGMHIVHNLVTGLLGGTIEVESKMNEGTVIQIELPRIAPESEVKALSSDGAFLSEKE